MGQRIRKQMQQGLQLWYLDIRWETTGEQLTI